MKKSNLNFFKINFLQIFIIMIFIGFSYFFYITRYKEGVKGGKSNPCSAVTIDDNCNRRNDCTWFKGGDCITWQWGPVKGTRTCINYSKQYCKNK